MAIQNASDLVSSINTDVADNNAGSISAAGNKTIWLIQLTYCSNRS